MDVSLDEACQRALAEICRLLGAAQAELLLHGDAAAASRLVARIGAGPPAGAAGWVGIPIGAAARELGSLRLAFSGAAPLPSQAEQALAQALAELGVRLADMRHRPGHALGTDRAQILSVTEQELQRIILDIHDGPVQKLFAAATQLAIVQSQIEAAPAAQPSEIAPTLTRVEQLIASALGDIRTTINAVRLAEFQRLGLPEVLGALAAQHADLTGNVVELRVAGDVPAVSQPAKIALYRVLQESLSNAYRHAGVDRHEVRLSSQDGWVVLEVADNGRGFDPPPVDGPATTDSSAQIGLRGMRERMQLVGGQLRVISRPGAGTRVIVQVPSNA
jgi:signal transduction histidine kinase